MSALRLLSELVSGISAEQIAEASLLALPSDELHYTLEYAAPPDLGEEIERLSVVLGTANFLLLPYAVQELSCFLLLRFPGIERTLPPRDLFEIGYDLCDALGLLSAEPDLGSGHFSDPPPATLPHQTESADVIGPLCWVSSAAPPDHGWALHSARIEDAWLTSKGEGILIGQPDSGVTVHDELGGTMLRLDLSYNVLDGSKDPTDPLKPNAANPGHGTGTASVAASRAAGQITGAAPAAELVPIRCLDDVKIFNAAPVTAAVLHATKVGCDVISMSLGGVPSRALHRAIRTAIEKDVIVVAAAGNCIGTVVWPARYAEVIAVAGSNIADRPWKGSSHGASVDITAPAELVWRAQRATLADLPSAIAPGQGTSFATALVAGIAALWLAAHGRDVIRETARQQGTSVQGLFRAAIRKSARRPAAWDENDYGPGIIDAAALLKLPLAAIIAAGGESVPPGSGMARFLDEEFTPGPADPAFDWPRYQAEVAAIALAHAELGGTSSALVVEAKWFSTRPSLALSKAAGLSPDDRLQRFAEQRDAAIGRPAMLSDAKGDAFSPAMLAAAGDGPEGRRNPFGPIDAARRTEILDRLQVALGAQDPDASLDRLIVEGAEEALQIMGPRRAWTGKARLGFEALVRLSDRPAVRVRGNRLKIAELLVADWHDRFVAMLSTGVIESHLPSIGRIDADFAHVGTGYLIGAGLLLTNRHVLQAFAAPVPRRNGPDRWVLTSDAVTIDFADMPSSRTAASRFRITAVVGAGADDIDYAAIDLGHLDAAVLAVETMNAAGTPLPAALPLDGDETSVDRARTVLVVGYPAQPTSLPRRADGSIDSEVTARLNSIFGADYGTKYAAPGEVSVALGGYSSDIAKRVFCHDATTLVGNSGSALIGARAPQDLVGLHFGGQWLRENYAHGLSALRGTHKFLSDASINWTNLQ